MRTFVFGVSFKRYSALITNSYNKKSSSHSLNDLCNFLLTISGEI